MSPVRRHFWQVVARVNSSLQRPRKWSLNWFMPAGVNSTEGSQRGTSTSLGRRTQPLVWKKARYFSRSSSVFMVRRRHAGWEDSRIEPFIISARGRVKSGVGRVGDSRRGR